MANSFYTIGHSTRSIDEFVALLQTADVERVIDIRTIPKSRTNPQYNEDALPDNLAPYNIDYQLMPELGGLRNKSKEVDDGVNGFWNNQSFHNYADYALSDDFQSGLAELIKQGRQQRCAMMCSEAVWWRCHRRIVSDYLLARGELVFHLMAQDKINPATLTSGAKVLDNGAVVYPANDNK